MAKQRLFWKNLRWAAVLLLGIGFLFYGWCDAFGRMEWQIVLAKAVSICFQCIGLG